MNVLNVRIYDFEESVIESGLPKSSNPTFSIDRAKTLGTAKHGSGHDCFLKGILVRFRLQADHSFWMQFMRYHFADVVSSESKMHCLTSLQPKYHKFVTITSKEQIETLIDIYNNWDDDFCNQHFMTNQFNNIPQRKEEMFEAIVMNCPIGLELEAGVTTNFLQLKTIYHQRKNHKMSSWKEFCEWIEKVNDEYKGVILK